MLELDRLSQVLWRERELLETLVYRLEVERLLLDGGRIRYLVHVTREIEEVLEDLQATQVLRATAAADASERLGLSPSPPLSVLAESSGDPWRSILLDHRDTMVALARDIAETSKDATDLIAACYCSVRETLLAIDGAVPVGDTAAVDRAVSPAALRLVDGSE